MPLQCVLSLQSAFVGVGLFLASFGHSSVLLIIVVHVGHLAVSRAFLTKAKRNRKIRSISPVIVNLTQIGN